MIPINNTLKFLFIGLSLLPIFSLAQQIESITGKIVNAENKALLGNALVISQTDSTIIKGTSFFDGDFELLNINQEIVLLKFTSLEFQDTFLTVNYDGTADINLGSIVVNQAENELDEVVVVGNIPLFETKSDGSMQVNVENTILATSTTVQEILSRTPNLIVDDESISLFGKGEAIIYLNGQRIRNEQLGNIQASEIKNIEIISNPSAKYDAEGQAVINIITTKNASEGIKGLLSQNVTVSDFAPANTNTNLSVDYRKGKISAIANYGLRLGVNRFILNTTRNRSEEGDMFNSDITTDWQRKQKYFANTGLGIQYNFNEDSYVSVAYNGLTNDLGGTESSTNEIKLNSVTEQFESVINKDDLTTQHSVTLNYMRTIDSLGTSLYLGGQYSLYNTEINDVIEEESIQGGQISNRILKNGVKREIPIVTVQLDYVKAFHTKDKDFAYKEQIYAAYLNYSKQASPKVNYSIGVRSELTNYELSTDATELPITNDYINVFPNATFGLTINENKSVFASYASRIWRPRYQSLNPSITYQDAFTSIQGNPNIVPEKIHAFEVGANLNKVNLKLGYNYTIDPIVGGAVQGADPKSYILQRLNAKKGHDFFASMAVPINTKWWTSTNTMTISYNTFQDTEASDFGLKKTTPQAYLYSNNKFTLFKDVKLQVLAWYLSNRNDAIYFRKNQAEVTLGVEKTLLNKTLKLQVVANDIFHTNKPDGNYVLGNTKIHFDRIYNTQNFRFIATYNFGKLKKANYNKQENIQLTKYITMMKNRILLVTCALFFQFQTLVIAQDSLSLEVMKSSAYNFDIVNGQLSGEGAAVLDEAIANAHVTMIGNTHNSKLDIDFTNALFSILNSNDYNKMVLEIGGISGPIINKLIQKPEIVKELTNLNKKYLWQRNDNMMTPNNKP
ncbi:hypothetical protein GQR58_030660 [Nymphon striatum]|nr:hypothetical protein GQR58_030660 [Nymphon striatum]